LLILWIYAPPANANQSAKGIASDYQAILTNQRINSRKAGANYSPLQQNHPNRSINCRSNCGSNPLEKTTPISFESFASKRR
jgi:hypothetical protein